MNISNPKQPTLIFLANQKGGVGKTTLALVIADLFSLHDRPFEIIQIDDQDRLSKTLGKSVVTISTETLRASRRDPSAGLRAFRPLIETLETAAHNNSTAIVDIGATQVPFLLTYAGLSELDADLRELNFSAMVFVPAVSEPEAMAQAARTIKSFKASLPSCQPIFVENERDGRFDEILPNSPAAAIMQQLLAPATANLPKFIMPCIEGNSWRYFERAFVRPLDVVGMSVSEIMNLTGLPRGEARIARGDIAAWVASLEEALLPLLRLDGESV